MNKFFSSLVSRISAAMIVVVLLGMSMVFYYWVFVVAPALKENEQSEVEMLISPYTQILENALDSNDTQVINDVLNRLSLLEDPIIHEAKIVRVAVHLVDGGVIERTNISPSVIEPFRAETPLFSPSNMNLLGSVTLEYSDAYYQHLLSDVKKEIAKTLIVTLVLLLIVQLWVRNLLRPLNELSATLSDIDFDDDVHLPDAGRHITSEVSQVWHAIQQLFIRLKQRDEDVAEEHKLAQLALEEKLEAEAANYEKSQFLANMSHELRTPLNAIIGYSEMLYEEAKDNNNLNQAEDLGRIRTAGRHLLSLINDVLDLSKIELGKTELFLETIDLPSLINEAVDTVQPLVEANRNNLIIYCDENLGSVYIDVSKFRQALINIMGNAAKFTSDGNVTVTARREFTSGSDDKSGWIVVRVKDTGIGISNEHQKKLFRAFTQADESTTRQFGGTGLGLAISRNICRLMGGDITVTSQLGKGSEFCLRIPSRVSDEGTSNDIRLMGKVKTERASKRKHVQENLAKTDDRRNKKSIILVIDDDTSVVDLMERALGQEGYQVEGIIHGEGALDRAHKIMPDLIVLDILISDVSGWSILAQLKKDPDLKHVPVIMHSALDERSTAFSLGASDYLFKPANHDVLSEVILRNLRKNINASVLIVDKDKDTSRLMRRVIENEGWKVIEVADSDLGIKRAVEDRPSAIILNLNIPGTESENFLAQLDNKTECRNIPVIALSGKSLSVDEHKELLKKVDQVVEIGPRSIENIMIRLGDLVSDDSIKTAV